MKIKRTDLVSVIRKACQLTIRIPNIPLSSFISLSTEGDTLIVKATDGANLLIMSCELAENCGEESYIVDSAQFSKLLYSTTTDYVEINKVGGNTQFKGNGKCLLETTTVLQATDLNFYSMGWDDLVGGFVITKNDLDNIAKYCYVSVARDFSKINIDNYLLTPTGCFSIDGNKATYINTEYDIKEKVLIPSQFLKYHNVFTQENINFGYCRTKLVLRTDNVILLGMVFSDPDRYPLKKVTELFGGEVLGSCIVNKALLMQALKRANIILGAGVGGEVTMSFIDNELSIKDGQGMFNESMEIGEKTMDKTFNISTAQLTLLLDVLNTEEVKFLFTDKTYCKIAGDGFEQMLSFSS